ncbi:MAG: trehalose-6-phosphate synthase, partial [Cyanobacteria bacterium P01_F01_bin.153]
RVFAEQFPAYKKDPTEREAWEKLHHCLSHNEGCVWITPLRDGLNLVAKEYVIAKNGEKGALILSEFVGAAVELPEAVLTNPYSMDKMDASLDLALDMSEEEQKRRMQAMYKTVTTYDVDHWAGRLFDLFGQTRPNTDLNGAEPKTLAGSAS